MELTDKELKRQEFLEAIKRLEETIDEELPPDYARIVSKRFWELI